MVSIFKKIFGYSWGPRLEYILRNSLLTLTEIPDATLKAIPLLLTNSQFRDRVIAKLQDDTLKAYWRDEFNAMPPNLQQEAISPILNKVGQFVASPLVRNVIGRSKSSIDLEAVMNEGKILLANLSQGKIGEDNSQILGAMLITKFQLAAMQRAQIPEAKRRDFYLYVDEFQNFATDSFVKILSEARMYHLNLVLANQYVAQIPTEVQKAILGNIGTLISFQVGAEDGHLLKREFAGVYSENDLVNLANRQIVVKLMIEGYAQRPFLAETLLLQMTPTGHKKKGIIPSQQV